MRKLRLVLLPIAVMLLMLTIGGDELFGMATCTGSDPCHACKNCRYCRHCAKEGGTCGICKRERATLAVRK